MQGGTDSPCGVESAERTLAVGFDGYAIGGLSVGESRAAMLDTLAATLPLLPDDQPRYLMGLGDPIGMVEAVALGIDLFDCVLPTRFARHGTILSSRGPLQPQAGRERRPPTPRSTQPAAARCAPAGPGPTCATCWSSTSPRRPGSSPCTTCGGRWRLVAEVRAAVEAGSLEGVRSRIAAAYG